MKKPATIITMLISILFVTACTRNMDARNAKGKNAGTGDGKNKTEGYFYHESEENLKNDSTQVKKNVKN